MYKSYLFIYDEKVGTREQLKDVFNLMSIVSTWRFDIPHCFYIISESSAQELYEQFIKINEKKGRFMFIETSSNRQGQMLPDTWYLLRNKTHKPKEDS